MSVPPDDHDPYTAAEPGAWGAPAPDPAQGPAQAPAPGTAGATGPGGAPGPAPGTDLASDLGQSLRFAGVTLLRNPVAYLLTGVIYTVAVFVVTGIAVATAMVVLFSRSEQWAGRSEPPASELLILYAIIFGISLLAVPLTLLWQAGSGRSGHVVLEGGRPSIGQTLVGPMRIIATVLLVGVMSLIGTLLLIIPGLIVAVLMFYAIPAAARGASPIEAIRKSFTLATSNLGTTIVAWLVMGVISSISGMVVVTALIMVPFMILFQLGMYERVEGRHLTEPAQS